MTPIAVAARAPADRTVGHIAQSLKDACQYCGRASAD
jgi:hypothetical protein